MCSYWRRSFELTRRKLRLRGMNPLRAVEMLTIELLGRMHRVLARPGRRARLLLRGVQHVLGFLTDRADHVGRAAANAHGAALGVLADLFAPVPDGESSHQRSQNESKHRRPPFSLRRLPKEAPRFAAAREVPRRHRVVPWKSCGRPWISAVERAFLLGKSYSLVTSRRGSGCHRRDEQSLRRSPAGSP